MHKPSSKQGFRSDARTLAHSTAQQQFTLCIGTRLTFNALFRGNMHYATLTNDNSFLGK